MTTEHVWFGEYPEWAPREIDTDEFTSLVDMTDQAFIQYAERPAFSNFGKNMSYAEVDKLSRDFACYLLHELKLKKGDRVAIMLPNIFQYPIAVFGILRAGLIVVNTNPLYTSREIHHQLVDSGAKAIIVLDNFAKELSEALEGTEIQKVIQTGIGDMLGLKGHIVNFIVKYVKRMVPDVSIANAARFNDAMRIGASKPMPQINLKPDDVAFLQYTGGTTGVAKGAMLTHRNMIANMMQAREWFGPIVNEQGEQVVTPLPMYHIFALTCNCLLFVRVGARNILITNPRDMKDFVKILKREGFTMMTGVNTLFNGLLNTPGFDQLDFSNFKMAMGGGMAVQKVVADRWKKVTGTPLCEGYGMTESSPIATINQPNLQDFTGSIGLPVPSTELSIHSEEGTLMPQGEIGEICSRGPQVMAGYWRRPNETAEAISKDGWLKTGDMGYMDAKGYFYIVDRKKDMILVSGFNVYPNEIEDVVASMPSVLEVAAVGVPDAHSGEVVKLVIVKKDPALTADAVKKFCKERLTAYKQPKLIEFRKELPKTNVGKILRRELRDNAP